jgi:hypothetical protein
LSRAIVSPHANGRLKAVRNPVPIEPEAPLSQRLVGVAPESDMAFIGPSTSTCPAVLFARPGYLAIEIMTVSNGICFPELLSAC